MDSLFSLNQTAELLKSFPDPVFVLSRHGQYLAVFGGKDPRCYHDGSILVGKSIQDVLAQDKADWFLEQIDTALGSNRLHIVEYSLSGRDVKGLDDGPAELLWFEGRISPLPFRVEGQEAVLWVASSITERKRVEDILRESESTFKKLFYDSSDGLFLLDSTGVFIECNQAALDLLKMTREQLFEMPPAGVSPEFQPDGRRSAEAAPEMIAQAYKKGGHRFDWTHLNAEGGEFMVEVSLMPIVIKGQTMLHVAWRDISERKRAEEALQQSEATFKKLFSESSDAILLIDSTGVFIECNQAALDLLKMSREQFLLLPPASISPEFQPDGRRSAESAPEMIVLAYSRGLHRFDWTCVNAEGGEFIVEVSLMPLVIKGQTVLHTTWRNITERKRREKEDQVRQQKKLFSLNQTILLTGMGERTDAEVCDQILSAIVELTESQYGYLYFYDEETEVFTLHAWSGHVLDDCTVVNPQTRYSLEKTGFWGEVVRQRRSLINNDFGAVHPLKKGYPVGHAPIISFLSVPIMAGEKIVAVAGLANKVSPYTDEEALDLQEFCQGAWNILSQRKEHRMFLEEQARYRQLFETLPIPCSVHELLFDEHGAPYDYRFIYVNQGLADLTGFSREEITGRTYRELFGKSEQDLLNRFVEVVESGTFSDFEFFTAIKEKHLMVRCYPAGGVTFVTLALDVTATHKLMERKLRDEIESREREQFSRELHDSAGQTFTAIRLYLSLIENGAIPPGEVPKVLAELDEEVADSFAELREIAHQLHPEFLSDKTLESAISSRCKRFMLRRQPVTFSCPEDLPPLPAEVRGNLYRIFQESLNNAVRYAGARNIEVSLQGTSSGVLLRVSDDGCGMGGRPEGFGIRSMRERAELINARFMLESGSTGTSVTVEWGMS